MDIVGRRHEVSEAKRCLASTRLLTLTGVGGVGKTRLALRIAAEMRRAFADGVWLVELASLRNRDLLARTVAMALALPESGRPPTDALKDYLRNKRLLLVMDNCEHLLDACAELIDELLRGAPGLRVLATSRASLSIEDEYVLAVPPLSVPSTDEELNRYVVNRYEGVALFARRAEQVMPDFTISAANHATVAQLCRRLDGIPLAIELAAVRLRALSPDQLLDRLDDRFRLLGRRRGTLPRQQTLRATVDWSFDLCSVEERTLWARLSVFSGGMDLRAIEDVCAGPPIAREDVLELVTSLIDKSILIREGDGLQVRYHLLETLREYGDERLAEGDDGNAVLRRHLRHYLDLARQAKRGWFAPTQSEWFGRISQERANFRVALERCLTIPRGAAHGLEITTALYGFWVFNGAFGEARHWLDRALQRLGDAAPERFAAVAVNATFALMQGELDVARPSIMECRAHADRSGDGYAQAITAFLGGRAELLTGDYQSAVKQLTSALDWYHANPQDASQHRDMSQVFLTTFYLAIATAFLGDVRSAEFAAECRRLSETAHAPGEISMSIWVTGIGCWRAGETRRVITHLQESLRLDHAFGYRYSPAWSIEALAWATSAANQHERAARLLGISARLRSEMGLSLPGFRPYADSHRLCESRLREVLGEETYAASFRYGSELGRDEALAYALGREKAGATPDARPERAVAPPLSPREFQVADLVAEGMSNKNIAARLVIAQRTAEGHVENILTKLGFTCRAQIAAWMSDQKRPGG